MEISLSRLHSCWQLCPCGW